jgi:hypothetical protein
MIESNQSPLTEKDFSRLSVTGQVAYLQSQIQQTAESTSQKAQNFSNLKALIEYAYRIQEFGNQKQARPNRPSRILYTHWLFFLLTGNNLKIHIRFVENILSASVRSKTFNPLALKIHVYPSTKIFDFHQIGREATLRLHEALIGMSQLDVNTFMEKLADRNHIDLYDWVQKSFNQKPVLQIRQHFQENFPVRKEKDHPAGKYFDLDEIFASVNQEYFGSKLPRPVLKWSAKENLSRMGSYNFRTDTITINRALDQRKTPLFAIRFIMYHEMLHKFVGVKQQNGRNFYHTSKFRNYEKQFAEYALANEYLSRSRIDQHKK